MAYVLGVDGGNTKTDYLLYTLDGHLTGHLRAGTCSHENLGGMEGARSEMNARISELLSSAGVSRKDIAGAAFGLAGIDQPLQKDAMSQIVKELGFDNSVAMNDSFLGIKAGSASGIGVCSINGTGSAAGGIDADGNWAQVGGLGFITGDDAGGTYIAARTIRAAYDALFRFGEETVLLPRLLALFGCEADEALHCDISTKYQYGSDVAPLDVLRVLFAAIDEGDAVALAIARQVADTLARSAAGCAVRLRFDGPIPLVLIGSVWTKGRCQPMIDHFVMQFAKYAKADSTLHILDVPPAVGSVLWALELAQGAVPSEALRKRVIAEAKDV